MRKPLQILQVILGMTLAVTASLAFADKPKPAAASAGRTFDPVKLSSLGRCQTTSLNWGVNLTLVDRTSGRTLTEEEVVAEKLQVQLLIDGTVHESPREGNGFKMSWRTPDQPGAHQLAVRLVSQKGTVDGPEQAIFVANDARVQLLTQTAITEIEGGCAKDARCVPLDLGKSIGLWPGLKLELVRKKPPTGDGWPQTPMHLKRGAELIELVRDKVVDLSYQPTETLQLCYAAPRCTAPPTNPQELIEIKPVHFCLAEQDDECKKNPRAFACDKPRAAVTLVVPQIIENSWIDCNLWWILIVAGVLVAILIIVGIVTPAQFSSAAMLRVANNQRQLAREQGRPLRREPGGKRGFYRTATVCFTDIGTTVKSSQGYVLQLKAGPDRQVLIVKKGGSLDRWDRNTWKQVDPIATGKDVLNERTLVSGGQYRVNGQYFFTVDF